MNGTTILEPVGYSQSRTCGYCKRGPSASYGVWAHSLSARTYEHMAKHGWRRSGAYVYKPDNGRTCCPQLTIKLELAKFECSKSQRQLLRKFANQVILGAHGKDDVPEGSGAAKGKAKKTNKGNVDHPAGFDELVASPENATNAAHRFETRTEAASFTDEKFQLYRKYQLRVHNDRESRLTRSSFTSFLIHSPIPQGDNTGDEALGCKHVLYRLDGQLIAFAVLDFLPTSLSSVYFVWDPDYSHLALGKIGALREIAMARQLGKQSYLLGFYIHSCQKMRYKADYRPSDLLDPDTYEWRPLAQVAPLLDHDKHARFDATPHGGQRAQAQKKADETASNEPDDSEDEDDELETPWPSDKPPRGCADPSALDERLLSSVIVFENRQLSRLTSSKAWRKSKSEQTLREAVSSLGLDWLADKDCDVILVAP